MLEKKRPAWQPRLLGLEIATGLGFNASMFVKVRRLFVPALAAAMLAMAGGMASAQDADGLGNLNLPDISGYAPPKSDSSLATGQAGEITLSAQLMDKGADITRGIVWRV